MAGNPLHMYSNESERANEDIYDDFKLKKIQFGCDVFYELIQRFNMFKSYSNGGLLLNQRLKRWYNIKTTLDQHLVSPGSIIFDQHLVSPGTIIFDQHLVSPGTIIFVYACIMIKKNVF